jgi:hypothetical protein
MGCGVPWRELGRGGVRGRAAENDERASDDVETLVRAWADPKRRLHALNVRWEKPVAIGVLGWESKSDASAAPVTQADGDVSQGAQAALFEAAFRAFRGTPWFHGIAWLEFNVDGADPTPDDIDNEPISRDRRRWSARHLSARWPPQSGPWRR